jgi:hypothetical protein
MELFGKLKVADHVQVQKVHRQMPLFLFIIYVAPQGSPYADSSLFEHICQEVGEAMSLGGVLLAGDFNARTGTNTDFIDCSQIADVLLVP